jgi:hypothetical protein
MTSTVTLTEVARGRTLMHIDHHDAPEPFTTPEIQARFATGLDQPATLRPSGTASASARRSRQSARRDDDIALLVLRVAAGAGSLGAAAT